MQVERMFNNLAPTYDKLNHTLSLGIDRLWRNRAIDTLKPFSPQQILDIATGTGDFAVLAAKRLKERGGGEQEKIPPQEYRQRLLIRLLEGQISDEESLMRQADLP